MTDNAKQKLSTPSVYATTLKFFSDANDVVINADTFSNLASPRNRHVNEFDRLMETYPLKKRNAIQKIRQSCINLLCILAKKHTAGSLFSITSRYRKEIKRLCGNNHVSLCFLKATQKQYKEHKHGYDETVLTRNQPDNRKSFTHVSEYLELANQLLMSDNFYKKALGIFIVTGRRPAEVVFSARLKKSSRNHVVFSGQLKTGKIQKKPYSIPVLCDSTTLVHEHNILLAMDNKARNNILSKEIEELEGTTFASQFAATVGRTLNDAFKREFSEFFKTIGIDQMPNMYAVRHIYLAIVKRKFQGINEPDYQFHKRIFQHGEDEFTEDKASHSYKDWVVSEDEIF